MSNPILIIVSSIPAFLCGAALGAVLSYIRAYREIVVAGIVAVALKYFIESTGGSVETPFYALCWGVLLGAGAMQVLRPLLVSGLVVLGNLFDGR